MRVVFFGTPDFAVPSLQAILRGADTVVGVVCQPDKPSGRGRLLSKPPVKRLAVAAGLPVFQPAKLRNEETLARLRAWAPDLIVVAAYGKILPSTILDLPTRGCVNVHGSLLPKYRGAAPIQWAILRGETATGVTIMRMNERKDEGDMLLTRDTPIGPDETYGELQERLAHIGAAALVVALEQIRNGCEQPRPQDHNAATHAPMIRKEDGRIDWSLPAFQIARAVRAFNPWPSAYTVVGSKLLKIHRAHASASAATNAPGTVAAVAPLVLVATGSGCLVLDEVQLEGRKRLAAADFARGGALTVGTALGDAPAA